MVGAGLLYRVPAINNRLAWRLDAARAYVRGVLDPIEEAPTPLPYTPQASETSAVTASATATITLTPPGPTATFTPSSTPLPASVVLEAPDYVVQDWNNCGPATLVMNMSYYGWEGTQLDIARVIKPAREDRNVNIEELIYYVRNNAGWLSAEFRVGGDLDLLKAFIAAGIPPIVEEGFELDIGYWPNDDRWAGHYLLLTGYDEAAQTFIAQDSFVGADQVVSYEALDQRWKAFNRVVLLVYLPHQEETVKALLGAHWDVEVNRQAALDFAQAEIEADSQDAFAWFNLGTNLVYFEQYGQAANAFDEARNIGLPQRMFRYQFGPFFAYFHSLRTDDLLALTEYALRITENSEETLLWHGWGLYRQGDSAGAIEYFRLAYWANPTSPDALYALEFMGASP